MDKILVMILGASAFACATTLASGQSFEAGSENFSISGGVGVLYLQANEIVYTSTGSSDVLSRLIWESTAPMLDVNMDVRLPEGWTLDASATAAISGDSYMVDYDWRAGVYGPDQWTDRSQHPDTELDWYLNGSLFVGRDFIVGDGITLNANAGFKYTDVQWTAYGGSFIYSDMGFRDTIGNFPDGQAGIVYRQRLPALMVGLDAEVVQDAWIVDMGVKAGVTLNASGNDNHLLRDLTFRDTLDIAPVLSLSGRAEYAVSEGLSVFAATALDAVFVTRGDTAISGAASGFVPDAAGASLFSASLSAGVKGTF